MKRSHLILWIPVVIYYAFITFNSSFYGDEIAGMVKYPFAGFDKIIHFCEYFFFGMVLSRALAWERYYHHLKQRWYVYFLMILPLAALADEIHQYFVPNRDIDVIDWVADVSGAICGATLFILFLKRGKTKKDLEAEPERELEEQDVRGFGLILTCFYFIAILAINIMGYKNLMLMQYSHLRHLINLFEFGLLGLLAARIFYLRRDRLFFKPIDWVFVTLVGCLAVTAFYGIIALLKKDTHNFEPLWSLFCYLLGVLAYYFDKQIGRFRKRIYEDPIYKRVTWQRVYFFLPPAFVALSITLLSAQTPQTLYGATVPLPSAYLPNAGVGSVFRNYFILHSLQFFVLGALYFRALAWESWWHRVDRRKFIWAVGIALFLVFCGLDEFLQSRVPGRVGDWFDVLANALGGMSALVLYRFGYLVVKEKYFADECFVDAREIKR